jgi:outer membrane lipoprotein SlyB
MKASMIFLRRWMMLRMRGIAAATALIGILAVGACGTPGYQRDAVYTAPAVNTAPAVSTNASTSSTANSGYGVVDSIQGVARNDKSLVGTIAGGVVGGLLGHQIGGGRGQTAATVIGAVGGAIAGNAIENRVQDQGQVYKVTIRMDSGAYQTYALEADPGFRVGDHVRVDNGVISRY